MKNTLRLLLVEDMQSFREAVSNLLRVYNDVDEASTLSEARDLLARHSFDAVILDKCLPDGDGLALLGEIKGRHPNTVVIVLTSDSDFSAVKHAIARGADDYVVKSENIIPELLVRIPIAVSRAAKDRKLLNLEQLVKDAFRYEIIGRSHSTSELRESIASIRGSGSHVLITGESGTGKELVARRLNSIEDDRNRPFVAVNCGAIPENLIDSELFGHRKGSFTGAIQDRIGKFEQAHNGDLFLDEIGELPLSAQARLLRAIQEGEINRVGDNRVIQVKCRIIAATNRNLESMVRERTFRADLYHRLNVIQLKTASLRERPEDIPDLSRTFTVQIGGPNFKITDQAVNMLKGHDWPGNIRELRNAIERGLIATRRRHSTEVSASDLGSLRSSESPSDRIRRLEISLPSKIEDLNPKNFADYLEAAEREYLSCALALVSGNAADLARRIGVGRSTVFKKFRDLGFYDSDFNGRRKLPKYGVSTQ